MENNEEALLPREEIVTVSLLVIGYLDGLGEFAKTDEAQQVLLDWKHVIERSVSGEKVDG